MAAKIRVGAVLLLVFAAGALSGILFERQRADPGEARLSVGEEHQASMAELRDVLRLDDGQIAQIHAILAERRHVVERMWEELRPEVRKAKMEVHLEINALLRPEQRERFHRWLREGGEAVPSASHPSDHESDRPHDQER